MVTLTPEQKVNLLLESLEALREVLSDVISVMAELIEKMSA